MIVVVVVVIVVVVVVVLILWAVVRVPHTSFRTEARPSHSGRTGKPRECQLWRLKTLLCRPTFGCKRFYTVRDEPLGLQNVFRKKCCLKWRTQTPFRGTVLWLCS